MNPFRNLVMNLQATGPAAVLCVWILSIAVVGVFGSDKLGAQALGLLAAALGAIGVGLVSKLRDS
jgi:hypothetical protein